jgi:tetratricopeptide (TPR) repeat protein
MPPQLDAIATLLDQGAADSAVRLLRSSWEPELPENQRIPMYCMWVRGLCETGDYEHALTLAKRAAEEFPREPDILIALGSVFDLSGQLEQAHEAFALAIDVDPKGMLQRYNLGAVLERLGREQEAEDAYRHVLDTDEHVPSMLETNSALGALLRRQGRLEEAEEVYDRYLEEDPINIDIIVEHGICLSDLDRLDEAVERFDVALSLQPRHAGAWYNKSITLYRLGRQAEATRAMRGAYEADPSNPLTLAVLGAWLLQDPSANLDDSLGMIYGALDRLLDLYLEADINPGYASLVVEELFEALWQSSRHAEARDIARMAGQRDWITPHMLETLNRADNGASESGTTFRVTAKAETADTRPEYWPEDAEGFVTDLTVVADDEEQARQLATQYLSALEPAANLSCDIRVVSMQTGLDGDTRPRGVARVDGLRNYFRG